MSKINLHITGCHFRLRYRNIIVHRIEEPKQEFLSRTDTDRTRDSKMKQTET